MYPGEGLWQPVLVQHFEHGLAGGGEPRRHYVAGVFRRFRDRLYDPITPVADIGDDGAAGGIENLVT